MSIEQNNIRLNNLKDVYDKLLSSSFIEKIENISSVVSKSPKKKMIQKIENFTLENINDDIENKVIDLNRNRKKYNIQTSFIERNSNNIENDLIMYNTYNELLKNTKYETIDNDGNLLFNAIDIEPTKIDAMMEDSIKNQYQQNNFFLAGTVVITSIFFGIVAISV